jgi:NAD(P)H-nitrite reductase large subunit
MDYLIIGGGPAGFSAAATLRRLDSQGKVTILAREKFKPYAKIALPYLLTSATDEKNLFFPHIPGVDISLNEEVVRLRPAQHQVITASGQTFGYDRLLIASGAMPVLPEIEGCRHPFVFTIRDLPDVHGIQKWLQHKTGRAVIAGAGPVGLETADALSKLGMKITLVIGSNRVFSTMLDESAAEVVEKHLLEQGVEVRKGENIVKIDPSGQVYLSSGETRIADLVIFGKGVNPCVQFLAGSGITVRRGIPVDQYLKTNIPEIYAAGDNTETMDIACGETRINALWPEALEQGKVAAYNMADIPLAYEGSFSRNILKIFGLSILAAGMSSHAGADVRIERGQDFYHKLVLDRGILKGFIFIGEVRNEGLYLSLLRHKTDISLFAGSVLKGTFSYPRFVRQAIKLESPC